MQNSFLGWASYSTDERYCQFCDSFYDKEDEHEHKDCKEEHLNDDTDNDGAEDN